MKQICFLFILLAIGVSIAGAQTSSASATSNDGAALAAKRLASRDPVVRQEAAEELARLEASEHRRVIEGYRLQEKNSRVKLALDWALYRMGKNESLFSIVRALDSSRDDQATSYLTTIEPEPLYFFLEQMNGTTQVRLLEVLAKIGNAKTLDRINPYTQSYDPKIAKAAQQARREIEQRAGQAPGENATRPRRTNSEVTAP